MTYDVTLCQTCISDLKEFVQRFPCIREGPWARRRARKLSHKQIHTLVTLATPWTLLSKVPAIWRHGMMHGSDYSSDLSMYCSFGQGSHMADSQSESTLTDYNGRQHRWVARRFQTPSALDVVGQRALVGHLSGFV